MKTSEELNHYTLEQITSELYLQNPSTCDNTLIMLYKEAQQKQDSPLKISIIHKSLSFTNFKSNKLLTVLDFETIKSLLPLIEEPELKINILTEWLKYGYFFNLEDLLESISNNMDTSHSPNTQERFTPIQLENAALLLLINTHISSNKDIWSNHSSLTENSFNLGHHLNKIISSWDLNTLTDKETVKLLRLYSYIDKTITDKIGKHCFSNNYSSILVTAQALGVVHNPDYWVQNLPSVKQQMNIDNQVELPEIK